MWINIKKKIIKIFFVCQINLKNVDKYKKENY